MRRLLPAMLALALLGAAPAGAHDNDQVRSLCRLASVRNDLLGGQDVPTYLAYGIAVTPEPGAGDFSCYVKVESWVVAATQAREGNLAFLAAGQVSFTNAEDQLVEVCARIEWADGHAPYDACEPIDTAPFPPPGLVEDLLARVNDLVFEPTDPVTCAALRAFAPGVPGVLDVDPATGDTYVAGERLWDCPPYGV